MAIYMEYQGITGDATASGHEQWITLSSCQFGVGRGIHTPVGSAENREASNCTVSEVVISKPMDSASGPLWQELVKNTTGKDVKIDWTSTSAGAENIYMFCKLTNTLVASMSFSSGGDRPQESVSLNFTQVEIKYMEQAVGGTEATGGSGITYDLAQAKTV